MSMVQCFLDFVLFLSLGRNLLLLVCVLLCIYAKIYLYLYKERTNKQKYPTLELRLMAAGKEKESPKLRQKEPKSVRVRGLW